ncbi:MAG: tRNA uridine-5-carboxymethylaminomethyl(34) synthesis GTPase MnmE [Gemmatimonadaceae bacterium]|nr:tRNA uridine-5-carboxymethylaminomethyl(34) synthesis GTPase MnmE [Gemmatimonadaceae bacterium]
MTVLAGGQDTIVAQATAAGRGAVALVRLSGARAMIIARALGAFSRHEPTPRRATLVRLVDPSNGELLDDALVTWFVAPHSYTGEDVVELATHGGAVTPARVVAACVAAGARPALPGEFTRRAVVNGRMDLVQAEAVGDLIDARTTALQQQALAQLDGGLSRRLMSMREQLIHLEALLAYDIDFPEEDDGPIDPTRVVEAANQVHEALDALLRTVPRGALVRDGAMVVLAGPPNAGKSSLLNALLGQSRAIVTAIPGTTRDAIEALLDRHPVPLRLVDTAGLRETDDPIERLGIEVSHRYLADAQVVLACGDDVDAVRRTVQIIVPRTSAAVIGVHTKSDLIATGVSFDLPDIVSVSAETGIGMDRLLQVIDEAIQHSAPSMQDGDIMITRERHRVGLATARDEVDAFRGAWSRRELPAPVASVHLFAAREALSELIGVIDTEDVLDRVFRDFCIGK